NRAIRADHERVWAGRVANWVPAANAVSVALVAHKRLQLGDDTRLSCFGDNLHRAIVGPAETIDRFEEQSESSVPEEDLPELPEELWHERHVVWGQVYPK